MAPNSFLVVIGKEMPRPILVQIREGGNTDIDKFPKNRDTRFIPPLVVGEKQSVIFWLSVAGRRAYVNGLLGEVEVDGKKRQVVPGKPYKSRELQIYAADQE